MKVIGFNASPRKSGNTAALVQTVLEGAESRGAEVRLVNLNELRMKGCQACQGCKKKLGHCVQKDDLSPILEELKSCDAVVLGTPVYWWHVSSQIKAMTDRFYCYILEGVDPKTGEPTYETAFPSGKKFVIVTSRGDEEKATLFPELYTYLFEWLKMVPTALGASSIEFVNHFGSMNERDSAQKNADLVSRARSVGASLV
ncbi:MAG: flavodoxin family protein [bacterium]